MSRPEQFGLPTPSDMNVWLSPIPWVRSRRRPASLLRPMPSRLASLAQCSSQQYAIPARRFRKPAPPPSGVVPAGLPLRIAGTVPFIWTAPKWPKKDQDVSRACTVGIRIQSEGVAVRTAIGRQHGLDMSEVPVDRSVIGADRARHMKGVGWPRPGASSSPPRPGASISGGARPASPMNSPMSLNRPGSAGLFPRSTVRPGKLSN